MKKQECEIVKTHIEDNEKQQENQIKKSVDNVEKSKVVESPERKTM